jgi:hypothetical protein
MFEDTSHNTVSASLYKTVSSQLVEDPTNISLVSTLRRMTNIFLPRKHEGEPHYPDVMTAVTGKFW